MTTSQWDTRRSEERAKRIERGQKGGFSIENLADDHPFFSFFHVKGASHLSYEVEIHSLLDDGKNCCTCPDYKYNGVGTCKHIEAVLEHLRSSSAQAFTWTSQKQPELTNAIYTCWFDGRERLCFSGAESFDSPLARTFFPDGVLADAYEPDSPDLLEFLDLARERKVFFTRSAEATLARRSEDAELFRKVLIKERDGLSSSLLRKPLKEYQVESVRFLLEHRRAIISEPFGTGKRIAALGAIAMVKKVRGNAKVVVVTDSNYFSHWKRLVKIFYPQGIHVFGDNLQRNAPDPFAVKPFFLCSYSTLLRDAQHIQRLDPTVIIFDEVQMVRKWTGQTGQLIKSLFAPYTFALSSSPVMESDTMTINLAQYFYPREFGPLWAFLETHTTRDVYGKVIEWKGLDELRALLSVNTLSRDEATLSDQLPKRAKVRVIIPMSAKQRKVMGDQLTRLSALAGTRFEWSKKDMSAIISTIRNLRLGLGEVSYILDENSSTPKQVYVQALLEELRHQSPRVVLHSHWRELFESIKGVAAQAGYETIEILSQPQADALSGHEGPIVGFMTDDNLAYRVDNVDAVVNYDLPWVKETIKERRVACTNSNKGHLVEFNIVIGSSLEERAMVVVETLPKLIGEWFDDPEAEVVPEPQTIRNLIRKLAGRREDRMGSSKMRKVEKSNSRERKISLKGIRDMGRPGGRTNERLLAMGTPVKSSFKKSIIWNGTSPLPSYDEAVVLLNMQIVPTLEGAKPALATLVNPANSHYVAFTPEHFDVLGEKLAECACVLSAGSQQPIAELCERFIPGFTNPPAFIDFSELLRHKAGSESKFHDISEATLGKRMVWDENEIRRLFIGKRYSDLAEVGRSDLKISWNLMVYIAREGRFFIRGQGGREEHQMPLDTILPERAQELMLTRQNL